MNTGEIWFVRSKNDDDPEVELVEIMYLNGNVVGFGDAYYDLRLLDFVGRDYEEEERRAQEKFMDTYMPEPEPFYAHEDIEQVERVSPYSYQVTATPTKLSWWSRWSRLFRVFTWNYF